MVCIVDINDAKRDVAGIFIIWSVVRVATIAGKDAEKFAVLPLFRCPDGVWRIRAPLDASIVVVDGGFGDVQDARDFCQ